MFIDMEKNNFCIVHSKFKLGDKVVIKDSAGYVGTIKEVIQGTKPRYGVEWTEEDTLTVLPSLYFYDETHEIELA